MRPAAQMALLAPRGWREKAPTLAERLGELLSDLRWHGHAAMVRAGGARFGARLMELHRSSVGRGLVPVHYEKRINGGDDSHVSYRKTDKEHCSVCQAEARVRPSEVIKRQKERIAELERDLAAARLAAGFQ